MKKRTLPKFLRWLADRLDPEVAGVREGVFTKEQIEEENYPYDADMFRRRQVDAAMQLVEDSVEGFVLFVLTTDEEEGTISLLGSVPNATWPAFIESMGRVTTYAEEHGEAPGDKP